jgi:hypothetical protein
MVSCVGGHAVEQAGDEFGVSAAASGEAELPEFCGGGTVVAVDRLIRGIGVDLAGAVAVDLRPDVAEQSGQPRLVVGAHAFTRGAPFGFGGHDRDGTVFNRPTPPRGSPADTRSADQPVAPYRRRCACSRQGPARQREPKPSACADRDRRFRAVGSWADRGCGETQMSLSGA